MRVEYVDLFVESAHEILSGLMPSGIEHGALTLSDTLTAKGLSATVFIFGGAEGRVVLDLDQQLAKRIAGIVNESNFEQLDHLAIDTICELTNIIIGKAITTLNNRGFRFRSSPPCFFIGEKVFYGIESVCIPLVTRWGAIRIQASIRDHSENIGSKGAAHA